MVIINKAGKIDTIDRYNRYNHRIQIYTVFSEEFREQNDLKYGKRFLKKDPIRKSWFIMWSVSL